jgi:hypothetical protein
MTRLHFRHYRTQDCFCAFLLQPANLSPNGCCVVRHYSSTKRSLDAGICPMRLPLLLLPASRRRLSLQAVIENTTAAACLLLLLLRLPAAACVPLPRWLLHRADPLLSLIPIISVMGSGRAAACSPLPRWLLHRADPLLLLPASGCRLTLEAY